MNLLIVDDERIALNGIMNAIHWDRIGVENVYCAYSAYMAKKSLDEHTIDIMLCDIEMPQENGLELYQAVTHTHPNVACIFLTCHAEFRYAQKALQLGGLDYIVKPVPYNELETILGKLVNDLQGKRTNQKYKEYGEMWLGKMAEDAKELTQERRMPNQITEEVMKYIRENINQDLSVELIARHFFLNVDYLSRIFKKHAKTLISDFITRERMFLANELLTKHALPVNIVAERCGYTSSSYFTKTYKKTYGITPSEALINKKKDDITNQ